jgi:hypothetical protein
MWRRFKNILYSLRTYADLSPDLWTRQRVKWFLHSRSPLSAKEWFEQFRHDHFVSPQVVNFVYERMPDYSGLEFSRVRPGDRLNQDLHLPLICWFDWQLTLCDDFFQWFGVDISDHFDPQSLDTVEDLVNFLNQQVLALNPMNGQSESS